MANDKVACQRVFASVAGGGIAGNTQRSMPIEEDDVEMAFPLNETLKEVLHGVSGV